ncbi:uncharacterized protein KY384_008433 [Bacidia gigantensis]|uniref:uncharacterized protein n=1 Tax=Bacidia gigantensis TaxID=2732470 RepID=UPI001D0547C9|nr:uncharacterized protein KY384_008433 [Bacidia gigantensis]KAG8527004.1 hypothetical protein KY384_008433 [Bacidia gigantensis]
MAAPPEKTLKDLSGKWNKTKSDDLDRLLQLQKVSWFIRNIIRYATITLTITEYVDSSHITHMDISQVASGGIQGTTEKRTLDWTWRDHKDGIFGSLKGRSRWCKLSDVEDVGEDGAKWLKTGWLDGEDADYVQSYVESYDNGWTANQVWGFEAVDGERYYVRHVVVRNGEDWKCARLVYDFLG